MRENRVLKRVDPECGVWKFLIDTLEERISSVMQHLHLQVLCFLMGVMYNRIYQFFHISSIKPVSLLHAVIISV